MICRPGLPALCLSLLLVAAPATQAWGPQGHRIAGNLAESQLTPAARTAIREILGNEPLSDASTWADRMRSDPAPFWQRRAGAYHYVSVPQGRDYRPGDAPRQGDAYSALQAFSREVSDPATTAERRRLALRFILHIVQDLHQPLHANRRDDRGGNDIRLRILGRDSNLHRVWDSDMIASAGDGDRTWQQRLLRGHSRSARDSWLRETDALLWIAESARLSETLYPESRSLGRAYIEQHRATLEKRLLQAGLRSAGYLNALFADSTREADGTGREPHPATPPTSLWERLKQFFEEVVKRLQ
jgi:hypothetical protein